MPDHNAYPRPTFAQSIVPIRAPLALTFCCGLITLAACVLFPTNNTSLLIYIKFLMFCLAVAVASSFVSIALMGHERIDTSDPKMKSAAWHVAIIGMLVTLLAIALLVFFTYFTPR